MKVLIPAAALALGAFAWTSRAKDVESPLARPALRTSEAAPSATPAPVAVEVEKAAPAAPTPVTVAPRATTSVAATPPAADPAWALELLRELTMSEEQKAGVLELLRERARTVAAYEVEVRNRGWFRLEEFAWRIDAIRQAAYDRIEAILDPERARTFAALRPGLLKKDFLTIAIPEEHVVSLD